MMTVFTSIIKAKRHTLSFCKKFSSQWFNFFAFITLSLGKRVFRLIKMTRVSISNMFPIRRKQFQVFNSVIVFDSVNMVDYLSPFKVSTERFFHYKSLFWNITKTIFRWMVRQINTLITIMDFPTNIISRSLSFLKFSFRRIMFSLTRDTHFPYGFLTENTNFAFIPCGFTYLTKMLTRTVTKTAFGSFSGYSKIFPITMMANQFNFSKVITHTTNYNTIQVIRQVFIKGVRKYRD